MNRESKTPEQPERHAPSTAVPSAFGVLLVLSGMLSPAGAQTVDPSLIVPKTPRVFGDVTPAPTSPSASRPDAQASAVGSLEVLLDNVVVDGAFEELQVALDALWSQVKGRRVTMLEVQQAVSEYQLAHEAAGFLLARVITPPQTLVNRGSLRLVVIDGFVETVETTGLPDHLRNAVAERLAPLVGMRHLQAATIERQLMLVGNMAGVRLRSALAPGLRRGGVRLVIEGTYDRVAGSIQVDNRLPRSLGTWEANVSLSINQSLGFEEKLYAAGVVSLRSQGRGVPVRTLVAGVAAPLNIDGLMANVEFTTSQSKQVADKEVPATDGSFSRQALRLSYPWALDRRHRVDLRLSIEQVRQSITATDFGALLNRDAYRVLRLGGEVGRVSGRGAYQAAAFVSRGLGGRDEKQAQASGIPLSRIGAGPHFGKLDFNFQATLFPDDRHQLAILGHGQWSGGKPLLKSEQLSLEGGADILAFPVGSFAVDSGAALRVEASRLIALPLLSMPVKAGLFAAAGRGTLGQPSAVENRSVTAASIGFSLHSVAGDIPAPWSPHFGLECATRRSNAAHALGGWSLMATIGTKL